MADQENFGPLQNLSNNSQCNAESSKKNSICGRYPTCSDKNELFLIDQLVEQLQSGAFCQDMDHPYYERYREIETIRSRKIKVAEKRLELVKVSIQQEFDAMHQEIVMKLLEEEQCLLRDISGGDNSIEQQQQQPQKGLFTDRSHVYNGNYDSSSILDDLKIIRNAAVHIS